MASRAGHRAHRGNHRVSADRFTDAVYRTLTFDGLVKYGVGRWRVGQGGDGEEDRVCGAGESMDREVLLAEGDWWRCLRKVWREVPRSWQNVAWVTPLLRKSLRRAFQRRSEMGV
jgi:hypothetical protein